MNNLKLELGNLHGRIGLFAEKWFGMSNNLSTGETFTKMDEALDAKCAELTAKDAEIARLKEANAETWAGSPVVKAELDALRTEVERLNTECNRQAEVLGEATRGLEFQPVVKELRSENERMRTLLDLVWSQVNFGASGTIEAGTLRSIGAERGKDKTL